MAEKRCAHEGCVCKVSEGETFCSDYCREHAGHAEERCRCGHPECG